MRWARWLLAALIVLNIGYLAFTTGALGLFGLVPVSLSEREPQRIGWQIRPEALQVRKDSDAAATAAAPAAAAAPVSAPSPTPATDAAAPKTDHEGL